MAIGSYAIGSFAIGGIDASGDSAGEIGPVAQTYPLVGLEFQLQPMGSRAVNVANGIRSLDIGNAEVYQITLTHPLLDVTARNTMLAFYTANRTAVNTLDLAGDRYNVRYMSDYTMKHDSATRTTLTVSMVGVR